MTPLPHQYSVSAHGGPEHTLIIKSAGLPSLQTDAPAEFGGSGDYWSPETLLTASVSNCFILTFRAVSRKAGLSWKTLSVNTNATLDKTETGLRFTHYRIQAELTLEADEDRETAETLLKKAKKHCLITQSLNGESSLEIRIEGD